MRTNRKISKKRLAHAIDLFYKQAGGDITNIEFINKHTYFFEIERIFSNRAIKGYYVDTAKNKVYPLTYAELMYD